jgi:alkyl hydroperoxide reductase subunit AhpC
MVRVFTRQAFVRAVANIKFVCQGGSFLLPDVKMPVLPKRRILIIVIDRDFTFVCPTEILAFNDALPQFEALNASVLG